MLPSELQNLQLYKGNNQLTLKEQFGEIFEKGNSECWRLSLSM
jgi:hypothetical protein